MLFPEPFGPRNPNTSPSRTAISSDSSARIGGDVDAPKPLQQGPDQSRPMSVILGETDGLDRVHSPSFYGGCRLQPYPRKSRMDPSSEIGTR